MKFIEPALENYCIEKSTKPSKVCEEIKEYTLKNEAASVMLTGEMEASFLGFFIRLIGAKRVLEFGTFTGYSALAMAENLPDDGEVITMDKDPRILQLAQSFWNKSPHGKKIAVMAGDAHENMLKIKGEFDFVFIDADKGGYMNYLKYSLEKLSPKGMIAIDNVLWSGKVITDDNETSTRNIRKVNDFVAAHPELYATLVPIRDGIFIIQKKK